MAEPAAPTLADGRYTIVRQLGEGGMATVFLGWDNKLKVWRAVKALLPDFMRKVKVRRRFENEAHAMARLEHPHIIRVYDVGVEDSAPYMVMEFAQGGCVIDWIEEHGAMPSQLAADVMIQISRGIHAAHEAGIVHRDIKPHNILATHKGVFKMTDFGIAQVMENDSLTKTGSVMGTWGYMAPEQRTDAKGVDERADIFGLGATLYTMLTGKTPTELYVADEDDDVFDGVEPPMLEVILKACSYKAAQRYPTAKAFAKAVHEAAATARPTPDDTPSLIRLPSTPLPESIESVVLTEEEVLALRDSLGMNYVPDEEPTHHGRPREVERVLPYYGMDNTGGVVSFGDNTTAGDPEPGRELTPDELVSYLEDQLPSYAEVERYEATFEQEPEPEEQPSYLDPEPEPEPEPVFADTPPPAPVAEPVGPVILGPIDIALRLAVIPLLMGIGALGVIGWGMVQVNGAHDEALQSSRPLHAVMTEEVQGPIIDGLALAGGDKNQLEGLLNAYEAGDADRMLRARAYVGAVQRTARDLSSSPVVQTVRPGIEDLVAAERIYAGAEADWEAAASGFPGILAVTLGLSAAPPR